MFAIWLLPSLVLIAAIASGKLSTTAAAALATLVTLPVALLSAPVPFGVGAAVEAIVRGSWIGVMIAPYIFAGVLFWQVAGRAAAGSEGRGDGQAVAVRPSGPPSSSTATTATSATSGTSSTTAATSTTSTSSPVTPLARRRRLFMACFLVGPFAEAATGFGIGIIGTLALIRFLNLPVRYQVVFALTSQCLIPWGAMGSGTLLAAAYVRMDPAELATLCLLPVTLLMAIWLLMFWRTATRAGVGATRGECLREVGWIAAGLVLLGLATVTLGPETALLAAYGPLIVLRFLIDDRPDRSQLIAAAWRVLPYAALILVLVMTRLVPPLRAFLADLGRVTPFADLPAWSPLLHAGTWLFLASVVTAACRGHARALPMEIRSAWRTGQPAILALVLFGIMAELLSLAGIAGALATGVFELMGRAAVLVTPLLAGTFGLMTNSSNAGNSLFMPSQLLLAAEAGLPATALVVLQHISGSALSMFSPVRMAIAGRLAGGSGQEREAYAITLPYIASAFVLLTLLALVVVTGGYRLLPGIG